MKDLVNKIDKCWFRSILKMNFHKELLKAVHNKKYTYDMSFNRTYLHVSVPINTDDINKLIEEYGHNDIHLIINSVRGSLNKFIKKNESYFLDIGLKYCAYYEKHDLKWGKQLELSFIYAIKLAELNNNIEVTQ